MRSMCDCWSYPQMIQCLTARPIKRGLRHESEKLRDVYTSQGPTRLELGNIAHSPGVRIMICSWYLIWLGLIQRVFDKKYQR